MPAEPSPAPIGWRAAAAMTKPEITLLIVLVGVAGFFVATPSPVPYVRLVLLVVFGALASGGAAVLNHYFDRDLDARMRRTRNRPLPRAGAGPERYVLAYGLVLSAIGVGGAALAINPLTGFSILLGGLTYVVVYTIWLKRRSSWNIVLGGFAGSAPALAGSAAAVGHWTVGALALALLVFLWTPPHFWSLALLLRDDYRAAGLPMLPHMDDPARSGRIVVVSCALLLPATVLLLLYGPISDVAAAVLVGAAVAFLIATLPLARSVTPRRARRGFIVSGPYLLAVIVGVVANAYLVAAGFALLR